MYIKNNLFLYIMWPKINDKMIEKVSSVLKSGKLNQWNNNAVKEFKKNLHLILVVIMLLQFLMVLSH